MNKLASIIHVNEEIKRIVKISHDINMLALNAIILSYQAGGCAVGFGVIANELRLFSKTLSDVMRSLMELSYAAVATTSEQQKRIRLDYLLDKAYEKAQQLSLNSESKLKLENRLKLKNSISFQSTPQHTNNERNSVLLHRLLSDAQEIGRFGCIISRSLKIEATYTGDFREILSQIAFSFSDYIDKIPLHLSYIQEQLRGSA